MDALSGTAIWDAEVAIRAGKCLGLSLRIGESDVHRRRGVQEPDRGVAERGSHPVHDPALDRDARLQRDHAQIRRTRFRDAHSGHVRGTEAGGLDLEVVAAGGKIAEDGDACSVARRFVSDPRLVAEVTSRGRHVFSAPQTRGGARDRALPRVGDSYPGPRAAPQHQPQRGSGVLLQRSSSRVSGAYPVPATRRSYARSGARPRSSKRPPGPLRARSEGGQGLPKRRREDERCGSTVRVISAPVTGVPRSSATVPARCAAASRAKVRLMSPPTRGADPSCCGRYPAAAACAEPSAALHPARR